MYKSDIRKLASAVVVVAVLSSSTALLTTTSASADCLSMCAEEVGGAAKEVFENSQGNEFLDRIKAVRDAVKECISCGMDAVSGSDSSSGSDDGGEPSGAMSQ